MVDRNGMVDQTGSLLLGKRKASGRLKYKDKVFTNTEIKYLCGRNYGSGPPVDVLVNGGDGLHGIGKWTSFRRLLDGTDLGMEIPMKDGMETGLMDVDNDNEMLGTMVWMKNGVTMDQGMELGMVVDLDM